MSNAYYRVGQYYVDTSNPAAPVLYRCTGAGDKTSSTWAQVSGGGGSQQFKLQANSGVVDGGDFYWAKTWDGTTLGGTFIKIAKHFRMRCDTGRIISETVRGITYNYTYTYNSTYSEYTRGTGGSDGTSTTEYCTPPALAGDIIYAVPFSTNTPSSLSAVAWIELTTRLWCTGL